MEFKMEDECYEERRKYSEDNIDQMVAIAREHVPANWQVVEATFEQDTQGNTDVNLVAGTQKMSLRTRRAVRGNTDMYNRLIWDSTEIRYKDQITVRTKAEGNGKTEIHKIMEGLGSKMLYGWEHRNNIIAWQLVQWQALVKAAEKGTFDPWDKSKWINNPYDKTMFMPITVDEIPGFLVKRHLPLFQPDMGFK